MSGRMGQLDRMQIPRGLYVGGGRLFLDMVEVKDSGTQELVQVGWEHTLCMRRVVDFWCCCNKLAQTEA